MHPCANPQFSLLLEQAEQPWHSIFLPEFSHILSVPAANGINSWHNFSLCQFPRFKSCIFHCDSNHKSTKQSIIADSEINMNTSKSMAKKQKITYVILVDQMIALAHASGNAAFSASENHYPMCIHTFQTGVTYFMLSFNFVAPYLNCAIMLQYRHLQKWTSHLNI